MGETEPSLDDDVQKTTKASVTGSTKGRRSLSSIRREIEESELSNPGTQKMLLGELDRLEEELAAASSYRNNFHEMDKRHAVLEARFTVHKAFEVVTNAALAGGSAILGFVPGVWGTQPLAGVLLLTGGIFVVGAIIARVKTS
jgi:hypothetical protein